ncbi:hypothetical protein [Promicromonospora sp. NPDC057488]|uniref:hypothetical protein n=1 Tax=Promicromonospora sp. NPDC057488 TaxID=3346147 RepID=UPI00366A6AE0
MTTQDDQPEQSEPEQSEPAAPRGRRRAAWVAGTSVLIGGVASLGALGVQRAAEESDLLLIAGHDGDVLGHLLWALACVCGVVLGVAAFWFLVVGYEWFTATLAAIVLGAAVLAACGGVLVNALFALLSSGSDFVLLDELDRPAGEQILVEEATGFGGVFWHVYQGGPVRYTEITDSLDPGPECEWLTGSLGTTPFAEGDYTLTSDAQGRDVLSFTVDRPYCDNDGTYELVLP